MGGFFIFLHNRATNGRHLTKKLHRQDLQRLDITGADERT